MLSLQQFFNENIFRWSKGENKVLISTKLDK